MASRRLTLLLLPAAACMTAMPGHNPKSLAALSAQESSLRAALAASVRTLAVEIGERNLDHPEAYARAADWTASQLRAAGLQVHEESYAVGSARSRNLIGEIAGGSARNEIVVIGAHYDSVAGTPGANDDGSGVAALLALARYFGGSRPARTLRFVAFANEEPPYFHTESMGSLVYARGCAARHENIAAMLSLETMGYFSDAEGSQQYPFPFSLLYPAKGNFIAFVGDLSSQRLTSEAVRAFRATARLPAEGVAVPDLAPGVGWSDHWSFWKIGVQAVMVTDTAPFRYPHYHEQSDLPDKLDYDRFARAVVGVAAVVERLARDVSG